MAYTVEDLNRAFLRFVFTNDEPDVIYFSDGQDECPRCHAKWEGIQTGCNICLWPEQEKY